MAESQTIERYNENGLVAQPRERFKENHEETRCRTHCVQDFLKHFLDVSVELFLCIMRHIGN